MMGTRSTRAAAGRAAAGAGAEGSGRRNERTGKRKTMSRFTTSLSPPPRDEQESGAVEAFLPPTREGLRRYHGRTT